MTTLERKRKKTVKRYVRLVKNSGYVFFVPKERALFAQLCKWFGLTKDGIYSLQTAQRAGMVRRAVSNG